MRRHHVRTHVLVVAYMSHIVDEMQKGIIARIEPGLMCHLQIACLCLVRTYVAIAVAGYTDIVSNQPDLKSYSNQTEPKQIA
jgi:hypothetical protein